MLTNLLGFALFAIIALFLLKVLFGLFGLVLGLLGTVLWFAFLGFLIYLLLLSQIMPGYPPSIFFAFWLVAALVSLLSAGCGAAIAGTTR